MQSEFAEYDSEWENLLNLKIFQEAVCLISTNWNLSLKIEEDAMKELESINKEINVVAITGIYRTGKSVLLNQLAAANGDRIGFGHATAAMAQGIWATCVRHPNHEDQVLMLLDTKGLGDIKKGNKHHDNQIFTIATLLSSTLIYNVMGTFNHNDQEKLSFIARFTENVALSRKPENEDKIIESVFPTFVLCIRDFFLNLQNPDEEMMTPKKYLEDCLGRKPSGTKYYDDIYNAVRDAIKKYFHRRHCFTFPRPTADEDDLKKLGSASPVTFTDGFSDDLKKLTEFINKCKPKRMMNGDRANGKGLASLARTYVQCILDGAVPCVGDAMMYVAQEKNRKLIESAVKSFTSKIKLISLPEANYSILESFFKQYHGEEIRTFKEEIIYDENDIYLNDLKSQLTQAWQTVESKNKGILFANCWVELGILHEPISKDVGRGIYANKEGFSAYNKAIKIRDELFRSLPDIFGDQKSLAIDQFTKMKISEESKVLADAKSVEKRDKLEGEVSSLQKQVTEIKRQLDRDLQTQADDMRRMCTEQTMSADDMREMSAKQTILTGIIKTKADDMRRMCTEQTTLTGKIKTQADDVRRMRTEQTTLIEKINNVIRQVNMMQRRMKDLEAGTSGPV